MHRRTLVLLIVISLGHVLLISAQVQSRTGLPVVEAVAFDLFARIQSFTAGIADGVRGTWTNYFALRGAARDNEVMRQRILDLEGRLQQQEAAVRRTRALEEALALKESATVPMLTARVIAGSPSPGSLTVTIDRGRDDGVDVDMAVIGARGVVGRIISPLAPRAALVQLLVGRDAAVGVIFERSGTGAMALGGAADGLLRAEYVPASATIQEGEKVTTSGQDRVFPAGYPVGVVERVRTSSGPDREIAIRPAVDFSHIDIVLVVLGQAPAIPKGTP
jgi:rod shape-determining protein MreC